MGAVIVCAVVCVGREYADECDNNSARVTEMLVLGLV